MRNTNEIIDLGVKLYPNDTVKGEKLIASLNYYYHHLIGSYNISKNVIPYYKLTENEILSFALMVGSFYEEIQTPLIKGTDQNEFISEVISSFSSLLKKIPSTKSTKVYRKDLYANIDQFIPDKQITFKNFLTVSERDNLLAPDGGKARIEFIISPLGNGQSKCKEVYHIDNFGGTEFQMYFECDTSFTVDKVVIRDSSPHIIHITELESINA